MYTALMSIAIEQTTILACALAKGVSFFIDQVTC